MKKLKDILEWALLSFIFLFMIILISLAIDSKIEQDNQKTYNCLVDIVGVEKEWVYDVVEYNHKNQFFKNSDYVTITFKDGTQWEYESDYIKLTCITNKE